MSSLFELLPQLITANNQIRNEAENYYSSLLVNKPDETVTGLMQVLSSAQVENHLRQLTAVLLRRCLIDEEDSYYFKLQLQSRQFIIHEIDRLLVQENDTSIRLKICDIAGELGGTILEPKDWPSLFPITLRLCKEVNVADREVGLSLLGLLSDSAIGFYENFLPTVYEVLQFNFQQNSQEGKGLTLTIRALNDCLQSVKLTAQLEVLQPLVIPLFQAINAYLQSTIQLQLANSSSTPPSPQQPLQFNINNNNSNNNKSRVHLQHLCNYFEVLIDIADHSSLFFQPYLQMIVFPLLDYLDVSRSTFPLFSFGFHSMVLEFLVTLSIHETKKIKKCKGPNQEKEYFVHRILPICVQFMSMLPEDPHWDTAETVEETNYDSSYNDIGEAAFRRCIASFGIKSTYTIISSLLSHYFTHSDWQRIYAGLQCLSGYVEITTEISNKAQLQLHRKEVLQTLQHFITQATHPRIRYGALYAASQFLLYHGNELEVITLHQLIQLLGQQTRIAVNPSPRVRRNALIALIQLIDISSASFVSQYVQYFLEVICQALQEGPTIVQESCVSAIISIAETSKGNTELWNQFYPSIMPILKQLLIHAQRRNLESLWCQTLECISVLGESAGKSLFYQDACELMDLLTNIQSTLSSSSQQNSSLESTLIKAWVRLGRCLGSEFLPYLPSIMEKLFEALSQDIVATREELQSKSKSNNANNKDDMDELDDDFDFENNLEGDGEEDDEDNEFQMIETNQGWVTVRTSALEEQSSALQMILLLTEKLQEYYYPYIEQTIQQLTKLLASPNEEIRSYSMAILPELIRSTGKALPMNRIPLKELTFYCLGKLLDLLEKESSLDLIMTALQAIKQILLFACVDWNTLQQSTSSEGIPTIVGGVDSSNSHSSNEGMTVWSHSSDSSRKTWLKLLDDDQMVTITKSLKGILRESLQRRAVLKAEKQLEAREDEAEAEEEQLQEQRPNHSLHNKDTFEVEDLMNEEMMFFQQSLELHYNISEVMNVLLQTHTIQYVPIFYQEFHELIMNFTNRFCTKEDQRFAFLIISDVIEFGLNPLQRNQHNHSSNGNNNNTAAIGISPEQQQEMIISYLQQIFPILHSYCQEISTTDTSKSKTTSPHRNHREEDETTNHPQQSDYELLRTIVYIIGIIYEYYSLPPYFSVLNQGLTPSLLSLHQVMSVILTEDLEQSKDEEVRDRGDREVVGLCKDNVISSIGMIALQLFFGANLTNSTSGNYLGKDIIQSKQIDYLLHQWLQFLPLEFDQDENMKVMKELLQFLSQSVAVTYLMQHPELLLQIITIMLKEIETKRLSTTLLLSFHQFLYDFLHQRQWLQQSISLELINLLMNSLSPEQVLATQNSFINYPILLKQQQQEQSSGLSASQAYSYHDLTSPIRSLSASLPSGGMATSPLATAPIHDVLLQTRK